MHAYAAMRSTVHRVGESGHEVVFDDADVECLASVGDTLLFGTLDDGLYRSADGCETFRRVDPPGMASRVTSVAVSAHDPDVCWAGTEPSAVWRSEDGGRSWAECEGLADLPSEPEWYFPPRPRTHHARWLEPDPHDPQRLYVGVEAGAFVLATAPDGWDAPIEWHDRPPGSRRDNHTLATHLDAEGRVYAAAGDGYAESLDGGRSWTALMDGLDHRYVWSLAVDPGDPDVRVVSAASGANAAHRRGESYVYRKASDATWERVGEGLPTGEGVFRAVLARGTAVGELAAVNDHGVYRSGDGGRSWEPLVEWPDEYRGEPPRGLVVR
ncbi:hypothetical protein N0B31_16345 [Salinirubellus salinus]|uniref:Exo-alpha-sialidase n=1 Tax=Salinirubellus salinus TaxID=1364945 RepID=A0A9E7R311_9EURY|nr:hypothetical protein [Salinirubellus salinus]UWM53695.1 hypothetical protein N0B31_16345 [Salinirubellus salinus]